MAVLKVIRILVSREYCDRRTVGSDAQYLHCVIGRRLRRLLDVYHFFSKYGVFAYEESDGAPVLALARNQGADRAAPASPSSKQAAGRGPAGDEISGLL